MDPQEYIRRAFEDWGMLEPGNIELTNRPLIDMGGGAKGGLYSMGFGESGGWRLVPRIQEGRLMSPDEAIDYYDRTGQSLGKFSSSDVADNWARMLSQSGSVDYGLSTETPEAALRRLMGNR